MPDLYFVVKALHIISSTVLFGTGVGIAFLQWMAQRSPELSVKYFGARTTVLADTCFTAPAAIIQPLTGVWLVSMSGYPWNDVWLVASYCLYALAILCWLPVVWIQYQLKKITAEALGSGAPLPIRYQQLFRYWFWLGWPAFVSFVLIFLLMVVKPR